MDQLGREQVLRTLRAHKATLAEQFGITSVALFGSVARDEASDDSDIDVLVEFESPPRWQNYFDAQVFLEDVLGRTVDMMMLSEVRREVRTYVERDAINV